jgi:hypothetical protein
VGGLDGHLGAVRSQSRNVNKHHGYYMNISRGRDYMGYKVSGENLFGVLPAVVVE